ncbi:hypothetical protein [Geobacillus phage GBSV1]|uniref:Uncharacterized protein n=2 Tax=Svunavirus TaxID=2169625 RepID=A6XMJ0_9CAUD|nr:hypothetical protein BV1_gp14 [Bacillus phage 1]YP_764470.1 hypothetical protein GPGV1_gp14 [Geobacillus phage GBSV1]ABC61270.1 hypothetical protein [Geobacillus phage GBSV1]ABJ09613.1 hypothetical protein [Bacillus phage 1]
MYAREWSRLIEKSPTNPFPAKRLSLIERRLLYFSDEYECRNLTEKRCRKIPPFAELSRRKGDEIMSELNYEQFGKWVKSESFRPDTGYKLRLAYFKINELLPTNEIREFYPKNIVNDKEDIELFAFLDSKLIVILPKEEETIFKVLYLKDISHVDLEIKKNVGFESWILKIYFTNNTVIELNSVEDSNEYWRYKYEDAIKRIYKSLLVEKSLV